MEMFVQAVKDIDSKVENSYIDKNNANSTQQFFRSSLKNQKAVMFRKKEEIYNQYKLDCEDKKVCHELKCDALFRKIITPWHHDQNFDFSKYKKDDFARVVFLILDQLWTYSL